MTNSTILDNVLKRSFLSLSLSLSLSFFCNFLAQMSKYSFPVTRWGLAFQSKHLKYFIDISWCPKVLSRAANRKFSDGNNLVLFTCDLPWRESMPVYEKYVNILSMITVNNFNWWKVSRKLSQPFLIKTGRNGLYIRVAAVSSTR